MTYDFGTWFCNIMKVQNSFTLDSKEYFSKGLTEIIVDAVNLPL
jgi:hypothetical protein